MDSSYLYAPPDKQQQPPVYNGGYLEAPPGSGAPDGTQPDHAAPHWAPPHGGHPYGFRTDFPTQTPGAAVFGGPHLTHPYGFDPSVPPPPFGCPPPGHFPGVLPPAPVNTYRTRGPSDPHQFRPDRLCEPDPGLQREYEDFSGGGAQFSPLVSAFSLRGKELDRRQAEDETALQRRQDQQWIKRFLQSRNKTKSRSPQTQDQQQQQQHPDLRELLVRSAQLVSQLTESCETLRTNLDDEPVFRDSYTAALTVMRELEDKLKVLRDSEGSDLWRAKVSRVAKRKIRRQRAKKVQQLEAEKREERTAEKHAAIDKWRMLQIQEVEEKKKEQELKLAADAVLCEVRKKQSDVKRMLDVLRSVEKLRKLRKEAASRKGIVTEEECDEAFSSRLEQLRSVMKKRTAVYGAEEKALMVMLEGEQEEERRREREKQLKKEREKRLQKKREVDAMLFGDEAPAGSALQPFREYYTQAERSLHALLQIRREWDVFVVAADHPDSSSVPQSWIMPQAPSDQVWASALQIADGEQDGL